MTTGEWISSSMPYLKPRDAGQPEAWAAEAAAKGRPGSQRIVHAGEVPAPTEIADLLDMMTMPAHRQRLRYEITPE
ncbi:hypothetical protein WEB32_20620 [Streptomyces netropsis]|uniref:Uncharacterized protein n=1 Tax=Streptomyces netropsis TaxID=55404 RepID=A0A7W7LEI4_STRNE|nr:hypothetical protein [Streptomyces netropsis]MBB4888744.1 hypothetical protein [Streptomyces netropsis]GGR14797.1 hypothetical protein GCM10010219_19560 [Streptomyces netropsis]